MSFAANDMYPTDELMRRALGGVRELEPTPAEVQAAIRAASATRARRRPTRRTLAIAVATTLAVVGTAFAVPVTRDAILGGFNAFRDFVRGGEPPGTPISPDEPVGALNLFTGADSATGSVLAQSGDVRLIAYRQPGTGHGCFEYGLAIGICRPDEEWQQILSKDKVYVGATIPQPNDRGELPLMGIVPDEVRSVVLTYADGGSVRVDGVRHGFIVFGQPARKPQTLSVLDEDGVEIGRTSVIDKQWEFLP